MHNNLYYIINKGDNGGPVEYNKKLVAVSFGGGVSWN